MIIALIAVVSCTKKKPQSAEEPAQPAAQGEQARTVTGPAHDPACINAQEHLRAGRLDNALTAAMDALTRSHDDPHANTIVAVLTYRKLAHDVFIWGQLLTKKRDQPMVALGEAMLRRVPGSGAMIMAGARATLEGWDKRLADVIGHIEAALGKADGAFGVALTVAQLAFDQNGDQTIDADERALFEAAMDHTGEPIPRGDPRRAPIFRIDLGDLHWALAYLSFQRALLKAALALELKGVDYWQARRARRLSVPLKDPKLISGDVKSLILRGLTESASARKAYLAETDDDSEWIPNPTQKNHGVPLRVDEALYERWAKLLAGVQALVDGKEALDVDQIAAALRGAACPEGQGDPFLCTEEKTGARIDVGRMFNEPRDLDLDVSGMTRAKTVSAFLVSAAGVYADSELPPSGVVAELGAVAAQWPEAQKVSEEAADRLLAVKLRYLLWLN